MRQRRDRGPWYLLTGLVIGLVLGVGYGWLISPVEYVDTAPSSLRDDFKDEYRFLIAQAYTANGNLARAQARLALLNDPNIADTLAAQAQRALAQGRSAQEVHALGVLAEAASRLPEDIPTAAPLTQFPTPTESISPSPPPTFTLTPSLTPTPSITPSATFEPTETMTATEEIAQPTGSPTVTSPPLPTPSPTPTPGGLFVLDSRELVCNTSFDIPTLMITALDAAGAGVPGVEVIINWSENEEHFFTGLKPELGLGYADFSMEPGITYTLRLADGSQLISDLSAEECTTEGGEQIWGSWELIFVQS